MIVTLNFNDFLKINEFEEERKRQTLSNLLGLLLNGFDIQLIHNDETRRLLIKEDLSYQTVLLR